MPDRRTTGRAKHQPRRWRIERFRCFLPLLISLGCFVRATGIHGVSVTDATSPSISDVEPNTAQGPGRLMQEKRILVETNLPSAAAGEGETKPKEKTISWDFQWKGWDGLHIGIEQKTRIDDPWAAWRAKLQGTNAARVFHLEELKMQGKIGINLAFDGAAFVTGKEFTGFDNGFELRRARLYAKGDCLLVLPVSYELELGYIPHEFYIEKSYLAFRDIKYIGDLEIGQFQAPMGLDVVTSSRNISFMEPAAPLQALAPGVNAGVQIGQPVFNQRATWALGFFTDGVGQDFGDASKDYARAITRFTGLPIWDSDVNKPGYFRYLHLGLSANLLYSGNSTVHYKARPESHLAPYVVDTGDISSRGALVVGTEVAWVNGPFSIQGEYLHAFVEQTAAETLNFDGFYASAGWFLSGESRPYSQDDGYFARVTPRHNFNWGRGGWGAWEIVERYSYVNLGSGNIEGGRLNMLMTGINWYLHSHVKMRFNYGFGRVADRIPEGNLNIFETRFEVDF